MEEKEEEEEEGNNSLAELAGLKSVLNDNFKKRNKNISLRSYRDCGGDPY
jgi:hypothetical protein